MSRKLNAVIDEIKFSDSPALASEIALFTLVETPVDLDGLVKRLEALESRLSSDRPEAYRPAAAPPDLQKKNEKSDLTPPPLPAAAASPAAAPPPVTAGLPSSALWKRLLGIVSVNKPMLYNTLLSVQVVFDHENTWKLFCRSKFEADIIEKAREELEGSL